MALHIDNPEVEQLAAEIARIAQESETEAVHNALKERITRLRVDQPRHKRGEHLDAILSQIRANCPDGDFGRRMSKPEVEEILGYGPDGV